MCEARDKNYKITSQEHKKIIPNIFIKINLLGFFIL